MNADDVRTILARHEAELMVVPGVNGVGVGSAAAHGAGEGACIVVYASQAAGGIPPSLDGVPVCVITAGPFALE